MATAIVAHQEIHVGKKSVIEAPAPKSQYVVVFEDDGETGYFYAVDPSKKSQPIQDAVQIYDVQSVKDRAIPAIVEVVWSSDNLKAALLINKYPHAVFNFSTHQGFCRSNFPAAIGDWSKSGHAWNEQAMAVIK
jgi:hypothetical protein